MLTEDIGKYTLNNTPATAPPHAHDDHAILDDLDVHHLDLEPRDIDAIVDNKTDDDQPDLDTDDSSGDKLKMKADVSMEGITEATDITTPVEMRMVPSSTNQEVDTSAQVSDFSEFPKGSASDAQRNKCETLFDITDPEEDGSDLEETNDDRKETAESERTLVPETAAPADNVEMRIKKREGRIDKSFNRISSEISEIETMQDEEYMKVSLQLSEQDEQEAETNFDKIVEDSFKEDKSEDWASNDSSPADEVAPQIKSKEQKGDTNIISFHLYLY